MKIFPWWHLLAVGHLCANRPDYQVRTHQFVYFAVALPYNNFEKFWISLARHHEVVFKAFETRLWSHVFRPPWIKGALCSMDFGSMAFNVASNLLVLLWFPTTLQSVLLALEYRWAQSWPTIISPGERWSVIPSSITGIHDIYMQFKMHLHSQDFEKWTLTGSQRRE